MKKEKNGKVAVYFFTNIQESIKRKNDTEEMRQEEQKMYSYEMYVLEIQKQGNLKERIESNYDTWLDFARQKEYDLKAAEVRQKRDKLLNETDWTQAIDTALTEAEKEKYRKYRQELRDITEQKEFPYDVIWPVKGE